MQLRACAGRGRNRARRAPVQERRGDRAARSGSRARRRRPAERAGRDARRAAGPRPRPRRARAGARRSHGPRTRRRQACSISSSRPTSRTAPRSCRPSLARGAARTPRSARAFCSRASIPASAPCSPPRARRSRSRSCSSKATRRSRPAAPSSTPASHFSIRPPSPVSEHNRSSSTPGRSTTLQLARKLASAGSRRHHHRRRPDSCPSPSPSPTPNPNRFVRAQRADGTSHQHDRRSAIVGARQTLTSHSRSVLSK